MKSADELKELKEEVEALSEKLAELNEEELEQVAGGLNPHRRPWADSGMTKLTDDEVNG